MTLIEVLIALGVVAVALLIFLGGMAAGGTDPTVSFSITAFPPTPDPATGSPYCIGQTPATFTATAQATHPDLGTVNLPNKAVAFSILPTSQDVQPQPDPPQGNTDPGGEFSITLVGANPGRAQVDVVATLTISSGEIYADTVGKYEVDPNCP